MSSRFWAGFPSRRQQFLVFVSIFGGGFLVWGCQPTTVDPSATEASPTNPQATPEITVVTTFLPMTQFTNAVAGERAAVIQLMPTNIGPHDYQARPEDVQLLAQAQVLVKNGLEMEGFLAGLIENAANPNLKIIDSSQGVAPIRSEDITGKASEDHHDHSHGQDHEHETTGSSEAHHHHHGEYNPHIWLDPKRAIVQVENIRDGLIAADPEGAELYQANAAAFIAQLQSLDQEITAQLQPFRGKTFVAFHDFAPYFAQSYNLETVYLVDIPETNPSPEDVRRVSQAVQQANLRAILTEPQANESALAALAEDLNVKLSQFDPIETGPTDAVTPQYYLKTMRTNAQNLLVAFGGTSQALQSHWQQGHLAYLPQPQPVIFRGMMF